MASTKRKARKNFSKKLDITKPISLEQIGTADDPCFGKHYAPDAPECKRCGDSEICAIAMGQLNHIKRLQIESTQAFKDLEEEEIKPEVDKKVIRKSIKRRVREMVKMGKPLEGVKRQMVVDDIFATYFKDGFTKPKIEKIITKMLDNSSNLKQNLKNLVWTGNQ